MPIDGWQHRHVAIEEQSRFVNAYDALWAWQDDTYACLFDQTGPPTKLSRYAFLGVEPHWLFRSKRGEAFGGTPDDVRRLPGEPWDVFRAVLDRFTVEKKPREGDLPPFLSGLCGYLSYEMLYGLETIPDTGRDDIPVPDSFFIVPSIIVASDSVLGRTWIASTGYGATAEEAKQRADAQLKNATTRLASVPNRRQDPAQREARRQALRAERDALLKSRPRFFEEHLAPVGVRGVQNRSEYIKAIEQAKEHILSGDVFEVCLTQRFDTQYYGRAIDLYRVLRVINETPFGTYLRFGDLEVASSSPERFLSLDRNGFAETRPIKGTRPRGGTPEEDAAFVEDLRTCEKDRAENVMIVDLARNDLGRVCRFGSVVVPELRIIETYQYTHQMLSTVRGQLREDKDAIDVIRAAFPGGSMTGAPKIESMKIIDRLEPVKRGIFSGSLGYFDFEGGFDFNIVIRTFVYSGSRLNFHVGGAIVADSDPAAEYQETLDKAHGLVTTLELVRQMAGG